VALVRDRGRARLPAGLPYVRQFADVEDVDVELVSVAFLKLVEVRL